MGNVLKSFSLFFILTQLCFAQWHWQNPIPPQNDELTCIKFFDENNGIVTGEGGEIYRTTNGGLSWGIIDSGITNDIWNLSFIDNETGIMITRYPPKIFITYDGGWNWSQLPNPPEAVDFLSCFISDSMEIYLAGYKWVEPEPVAALFYTSDLGNTWTTTSQFGYSNYLNDLVFINYNIVLSVTSDGKIYRSTDRGLTWTQTFSAPVGLRSISFCDSSNGIVVGGTITYQKIYKTSDSGLTWQQTSSTSDYLKKLYFYNLESLFAVGSDYSVYKSSDQGSSWNILLRLGSGISNSFNGISITDVNHIMIAGTAGKIYKSSDSGSNWVSMTEGSTNDLFAVSIADQNYEMAVGRNGNIQRTTNGGASWQAIASGFNDNFNGISSLDTITYIVVGRNGRIIKTYDNGVSWIEKYSGTSNELNRVNMFDIQYGLIVGHNGTMLKTYDGGENWQLQIVDSTMNLVDICFLDHSTILAAGNKYVNQTNHAYILRSTDDGLNWETVYDNLYEWLHKISSMGNQGGIAGGGANTHNLLLRSTDRGENWTNLNVGGPYFQQTCTGVSFIDSLNGVICFEGGIIYGTSDGGDSWYFGGDFFQCITQSLYDIHMLNENYATAVGWCGTIASNITYHIIPIELNSFTGSLEKGIVSLKWSTASELNNQRFEIERKTFTNNSGSGWILIGYRNGKGTSTELNNYTFEDNIGNVYAEKFRYRLKQIDYGGNYTYSQVIEVQNLPISFSLSQNYPNPFNPSTIIKYSVPQNGNIELEVFNILGQRVAELVNKEVKAGNYEVRFDASDLASGIYLYRIKAGDYIQARKMILLK